MTMKRIFFAILLGLSFSTFGQDLINGGKTSTLTYIFKLDDSEVKQLLLSKKDANFSEALLHTKVDSFPTAVNYSKTLKPGYYLEVYLNEYGTVAELISILPFQLKLFNNHADLAFMLHDSLGNTIRDARLKINNTNIHFQEKTQIYSLNKRYNNGLLEIAL